jgi:predicted ribonuclease YlaK
LELENNWSLSLDREHNEALLRGDVAMFEHILSVFDVTGAAEVLITPDTNALIASPDPVAYRGRVGPESFTFILVPTVLGELDRLKVDHRDPDVREKAQKAITRIKGWSQQGPLLNRVKVDKSMTIKALAREPDMQQTLSWLDANVPDDRIIASILSLQAERPGARIVLVTGDVNLQNKSNAALVETAEAP